MKVFYWSPYLDHVATVTAVINSALALKKYSSKNLNISIINSAGEWNNFKKKLEKKKINILNLYQKEYFTNLPKYSFIKSRYSYLKIFILSFFSLRRIIKKENPDYLIIHLITSLPIVLNFIFNFDTKFILRISGYPKLNFTRKLLWKLLGKNLHKIVCPTEATRKFLIDKKIFDEKKIFVLKDPIIEISKINYLKRAKVNNIEFNKNRYLLSIGRLSKQKNFLFLIKCFNLIVKKYSNFKLIIIGEGELENEIKNYINKLNLNDKIKLLPFQENIFNYLNQTECLILSSLWEDPGFVLIEAASVGTSIISSNCPNGPIEFLENGKGGFLFESNDINNFLSIFQKYVESTELDKNIMRLNAKKKSNSYSTFRHYLDLIKILN